MEGRSTWSGRERSSHSRFPPVPRVGLVTFLSSHLRHLSPSISRHLRWSKRGMFWRLPHEIQ
jgi:hypothetical protein